MLVIFKEIIPKKHDIVKSVLVFFRVWRHLNMKIYDYYGKKNVCGEKVRIARQKEKLSQGELAAKLQIENVLIEQKSVSRLEIGQRFVADYELRALSKILKVDVNWLLTDDIIVI